MEKIHHGGEDGRDFDAWVSRLRLAGKEAALVTLQDVTERLRLDEASRSRTEQRVG